MEENALRSHANVKERKGIDGKSVELRGEKVSRMFYDAIPHTVQKI
jgi:hypothetical protein